MKFMKRTLSFVLCLIIVFSSYTLCYAEDFPAPVWTVTGEMSTDDLVQYAYIQIETPTFLPYKIDYYTVKCSDSRVFIIDDPTGGIVVINKSVNAEITYTVNGNVSPSYNLTVTLGMPKDFEDHVTGVKAQIDETVPLDSTFSISAGVITDGEKFKTAKKKLSTFGQFLMFDLHTVQKGEEYNTQSEIKWSLPVPDLFDTQRLILYKMEDDGALTETKFVYDNGYAVFSSYQCGIYVLYFDKTPHTGDVNLDGRINTLDAKAVLKHISKLEILSSDSIKNADVNDDGKVNTFDAKSILRYVAGLELLKYLKKENQNN